MLRLRFVIVTVSCILTASAAAVAQAPAPVIAAPTITTPVDQHAENGAQIVAIADSSPGATIFYTTDGSEPTAHATPYQAPFLVASDLIVRAVAIADGKPGVIASRTFAPGIPAGSLVWSDEFANVIGPARIAPDPHVWTYDTGLNCCGNHELETYCAWGVATAPCDPAQPNAFIAGDGYLHIVARQPTPGTYTSARLKSHGLFTVSYGTASVRIEARMKLPLGQGMWPAFWTLGNNIDIVHWPASGEQDIMEHINAPSPDWIAGSLHGPNGDTTQHYPTPPDAKFSAGDWHTYGMIWSKQKISFYVDSPSNIYATATPADFNKPGAVWPFDSGGVFLLLNLAVGGDWPKSPDATTKFPSELLVDYVRVYTN